MRTLKTGRRPARPKTAKERKAEQLLDDAKRLLAGFPGRTGDMDFMIDAAGTIVSGKKFLDDRDDDGENDSPPEFRDRMSCWTSCRLS